MSIRELVNLLLYLNITLLLLNWLCFLFPFSRQHSLSNYHTYSAIFSVLAAKRMRGVIEAVGKKNNHRAVVFLLILASLLLIKSLVLTF